MKVQDLLKDMEQRAFSSVFHDVIIEFYNHDTSHYATSVEEDYRTATDRLSKILTAEQNKMITQIETLCTQNRQYAATFGFKCGIYSALQQVFTNINYRDGGFDTYVSNNLLRLPEMKTHHKFYKRFTEINSLEKSIKELLCNEDKNHISRIIKTISKGVVFIISPSFKRLYRRSSYLRYNQYKHCGFVSMLLQLDWFEVTQTTVTCLNW